MGAKVAYPLPPPAPTPWDPYTTILTIDNWQILSKYLAIWGFWLPQLGQFSKISGNRKKKEINSLLLEKRI
jgi:hypothetical protein